jgi:hypothetical protein
VSEKNAAEQFSTEPIFACQAGTDLPAFYFAIPEKKSVLLLFYPVQNQSSMLYKNGNF